MLTINQILYKLDIFKTNPNLINIEERISSKFSKILSIIFLIISIMLKYHTRSLPLKF